MRKVVRFKDFFMQLTVLSIFVFGLVALYPTESFFDKEVKAIYSIDVNPGIIVMVDEDETVLHIEGIDAESQELISNIKYRKKNINQVMTETINQLITNGYINNQEKNYVVLSKSMMGGEEEPVNYALVDLIHDTVWEQIDGEVEVYYYQGTEEVYAEARTRGLTPGIALLLNELGSQNKIVIVEDKIADIKVEPTAKKVNVVRELAKMDEKQENIVTKEITIDGTVIITAVTDVTDEGEISNQNGRYYHLHTSDNKYYRLDFSKIALTQMEMLNGHNSISATGRFNPDNEKFEIREFSLMPQTPATGAYFSGDKFAKNRQVAVYMINFTDAKFPYTQGQIKTLMDDVKSWWTKMSDGQVTLNGNVYGPVTIPFSKRTNISSNQNQIADHIMEKYKPTAHHILLMFPSDFPGMPYGGMGQVGCVGSGYPTGTQPPCFTWIKARATGPLQRYIIAHELGHNLGAFHAERSGDEYGDASCIMGNMHNKLITTDYVPIINAPHMNNIGLLGAVQEVKNSGIYTIAALSASSTTNPKLLTIQGNSASYIGISYRQNSGKDAGINSFYTKGASVHRSGPKYGFLQYHSTNTDLLAVMVDGGTYSPPGTGITIKQLSKNSTSVTVEINTGTTAPVGRKLTVNSLGASGVSITTNLSQYKGTTNYTATSIPNGTVITISAPQTAGNATFTGWTGIGCSSTSRENTITMNQDITCIANYKQQSSATYSLQVYSTGTNGVSISASSGYNGTTPYTRYYNEGSPNITLTAPNSSGGASFTGWTGTGCSSSSASVTVNMTQNRICTANYASQNKWQLSVSSTGASAVKITASPSTYDGITSYTKSGISHGNQITLTAPTTSGSLKFSGWSGLGCTNSGVSTTVSMTANRNCVANYSSDSTPSPTLPAPTGVTCSASNNSVTVRWNSVSGAQSYRVSRCVGSNCNPNTDSGPYTSTQATIGSLSSNTTYRFYVYAGGPNNQAGYASSIVTCTTSGTTTPPPTTNLVLSCNAVGSNQINLSWNHITGVSNYFVWSCIGSSCRPSSHVGTTGSTSYSVTGLSPRTTYRFAVNGPNNNPTSNFVTCATGGSTTPPPTTRLATVTGVSCSATSNSVTVRWNSVSGATGYQVHRCQGAGCHPSSYGTDSTTTQGTIGSLLSNTTYRFFVYATASGREPGLPSSIVTCTTSGTTTPPPTTNLVLSCNAVGSNQINLSWNHITGVSNYFVWSCIGSSCRPSSHVGTTGSTSYSVTGLSPSTTYRFAVNGPNNNPTSNFVTCTTSGTTTPTTLPAPTGVTCSASNNSVTVRWNSVSGAQSYHVSRCVGSTCNPTTNSGPYTGTQATIGSLSSNTTYRFYVYAGGPNNQAGYASDRVTCTTSGTTTPPPSSNRYATPTGLSCTTTSNSVDLYWNSVSGAAAYYLYSCSGYSCNPSYYPVAGMTSTNSRKFTSLSPNTTYNYQVVATGTMLDMSYHSQPKSCTTSGQVPSTPGPSPTNPGTGTATGTINVTAMTRNTLTVSYNYQNATHGAIMKLSNYAYFTHFLYSTSSGTTVVEGHPSIPGSILQPGTTYTIELFAKTSGGQIGERIAVTSGRTLN